MNEEATMGANGRDARRREARLELLTRSEAEGAKGPAATRNTDVIFDFSDGRELGLTGLALVLTARLRTGPGRTVRVRKISFETWTLLRALGLDHLFAVIPEGGDEGLN